MRGNMKNQELQTRIYHDTDNDLYIELIEHTEFESFDYCYYVSRFRNNYEIRYKFDVYDEAVKMFNDFVKEALSGVEPDATKIHVLGLSARAYNALMRANIKTIPQLLDIPKTRLKRIRNLGEKCLSEIEEAVKEHGYQLVE